MADLMTDHRRKLILMDRIENSVRRNVRRRAKALGFFRRIRLLHPLPATAAEVVDDGVAHAGQIGGLLSSWFSASGLLCRRPVTN